MISLHRLKIPHHRLFIMIASAIPVLVSVMHAIADGPRYLPVEHVMDIQRNFNQPTEVAVSENGHIFVLDGANDHVVVFDETGKFLSDIGRSGDEDGELRNPVGFCMDPQQRIYIADTGNQRIQIFNVSGDYLRKIDLSPWNARPVEVTLLQTTGRMYVSDGNNHQILSFDQDGSLAFIWGTYGKGSGEFKFPGMSLFDNKGAFYVIDILNGRIQIFDGDGKNPRQMATLGILPGQLFRPKGIAVDGQSRIFVADSYTGVIQVFDPNGSLYGILSRTPDEYLRLTTPIGMAFDSKGRFYVVQASLNTISVFQFVNAE